MVGLHGNVNAIAMCRYFFVARSQDQMWAQAAELRRKYDDLVSFTINLTAEKVSTYGFGGFLQDRSEGG